MSNSINETINVGLMISDINPEWVVAWTKRFGDRTYVTQSNIYVVLAVKNVTVHELLTLIAEYQLAIGSRKGRVLYKHYNQPDMTRFETISKFPLPLLDVYLSKTV